MYTLSVIIDRINQGLGRSLSWLVAFMALTVVLIVLLRFFLNQGSIATQEVVTYMHASLFLLCMGFTLQGNGHVRVDVFYRRFSRLQKAWIDALGGVIFLLPFSIFLAVTGWDYAARSWSILEASADPGGLATVYLLKSLIPLAGILLALQTLADITQKLIHISFIEARAESPLATTSNHQKRH